MITSVQDLLPHLGPGFVEECLLYYKFKVNRIPFICKVLVIFKSLLLKKTFVARYLGTSYHLLSTKL